MLEDDALELLKALQGSSTGESEANGQLKAGYQRLWDLGALRKFDKIRKRLFRFVVCAFVPLEPSIVAHALRIGIEDGDQLYRKEISIANIDKLCSNFLQKDEFGHLNWTHDSARDFVVRVILNPGIDLAETGAEETSMKSNHLSVANTFIAVMKDSHHPVWKELDLDPPKWNLLPREQDSSRGSNGLVIMKIQGAQSSLEYLGRHGWLHCQHAADKHVISDPLWTRVLRELILHPKTAFGLWWRVWFRDSSNPYLSNPLDPFNNYHKIFEEIRGDYAGECIILAPHTFAFLNLKADSVWDVQLEKAAKAPPERSTGEDLVESLVRHAACKNLNGANVLHLACSANNGSILNLMLQAILHRHGGVARVFELLQEKYEFGTPFMWACDRRIISFREWEDQSQYDFDVMEILLRFENDYSRRNGCDQSSNRAPSLCLWSHKFSRDGHTALTALMEAIPAREECLIRLLDIHKPCDIDVQNETGYGRETALHLAARLGLFQLVKVLVEKCHATVNVLDFSGKIPLDDARDRLEFGKRTKWVLGKKPGLPRVVEYLESIN